MARHIRNLLMMAALCWVAPVSAQQLADDAEQAHGRGCPDSEQSREVLIVSEQSLGEVPLSAAHRAFMP